MEIINQLVTTFVQQYGLIAICLILFIETGLLVGFFLPGDSLLFLAGIYAAKGYFPLWQLLLFGSIAAIIGDSLGYWIGKVWGRSIEKKQDSIFLDYHHLELTEKFYKEHGGKTIVIARFIGFLRTFAPLVAGASRMHYRTFLNYNIFGGIGWVVSLSLLGYYLGSEFTWLIHIADLATIILVVVSLVAGVSVIFYRLLDRHYFSKRRSSVFPPLPHHKKKSFLFRWMK